MANTSENQVASKATTDALKQLQKAETAQAKLEEKLVKSNEKLNEMLAKDEEQLAKKTEAVDKVKEKVSAVKKDLTKAVKAEDAEKQAELQEKLTTLEADLEKKKEAKKAYTDKVKKAKADNAKLVKDIEKGAKEIEKLKAIANGEAPAPKKAPAKKAAAPKTEAKAEVKEEAKAEVKEEAPKAEKKAPVKKAPAKKAEKKVAEKKEYKNRLRAKYENEVRAELQKEFNFKNPMEIPKLEKIVLNTGLGDVKDNSKSVQTAIKELSLISGQKPFLTTAKKSVANFKVREGMNVGAKVTLRGDRMYEFLDKFISIVLPRVRDFKGVSDKSFDGRGNYAMGVKEQLIFPEISYDEVEKVRGMDICIVTTAKTDEHAKGLLKLLGMPFKAN